MNRLLLAALGLALTTVGGHAVPPPPAGLTAGFGEWIETDGARVRVLVGEVKPDGSVSGMVEIDLDAGWKTYWTAPGPTGIPPQFSAAGSRNVDLVGVSLPAPHRFRDAYGVSVGYLEDVAFSVDLALAEAAASGTLRFGGFIGVCKEICVPFPFAVEGAIERGRAVPMEVTLPIGRARMALPIDGAAGALAARVDGDEMAITGLPAGDIETFVAPPDGLALGDGERTGSEWRAPIRRGEPVGDVTVVLREGALETIHRVPIPE